jgi:hypothetical protein
MNSDKALRIRRTTSTSVVLDFPPQDIIQRRSGA